jgi:hypothetical protein
MEEFYGQRNELSTPLARPAPGAVPVPADVFMRPLEKAVQRDGTGKVVYVGGPRQLDF